MVKCHFLNKFLFTQLSVIIPFSIGLSLALATVRYLKFCFFAKSQLGISEFLLFMIVFVFFFVASTLLSLYLWGRILVLLGILTKEEAKGYPYSKPWENRDVLKGDTLEFRG